jgi:hypothetical protein
MSLNLSDTDYGHHLLGEESDLDAQLLAIRDVLQRNRAAETALAEEIDALSDPLRSGASWRVQDLRVDRLHHSVYQDAAHSLSAAGMLAPLVETVFVRAFAAIGARPDWPSASTSRLDRAGRANADFWKAQVYFPRSGPGRTDIARGVQQLAQETGMAAGLPSDYASVLTALFAYRNQVFHNGLEWPVARRETLDRLIISEGWPATWFTRATSAHKTWVIYLSDAFVARCLEFVGEVLAALGMFARQRYESYGYAAPGEQPDLPPDWLAEA